MTNAFDIAPEFMAHGVMKRLPDPRASTRAWIAFALACLLHVGFVGLFIYDDLKNDSGVSAAEQAADVDLVDESDVAAKDEAKGQASDSGKGEGAKSETRESTAAKPEPSPSAPEREAAREKADTPPSQPETPPPPGASTPPAAEASGPTGPVEPPPPPASGGAPKETAAPAEQPTAAAIGAGPRPPPRLPTFAMPNLLGATQAPTIGSALSEEYKGVVYGMLEKAKRDPDGPRPKPMSAVVTFDIDDAGNPRAIALARGSGRPDIDAEALALVRRVAPFPPPPTGVFRSFAPMIIFPAH